MPHKNAEECACVEPPRAAVISDAARRLTEERAPTLTASSWPPNVVSLEAAPPLPRLRRAGRIARAVLIR